MPETEKLTEEALEPGQLLEALKAIEHGDFSVRLPAELKGTDGKIAAALNRITELNQKMAKELKRISEAVGRQGQTDQRAQLEGAEGMWQSYLDSTNSLVTDLVQPTAEVSRVIRAVAKGDLSQRTMMEVEGKPIKGEFLRIAEIVNTMVDQLSSFASEVTRVAREVGTEGKLGGQAQVEGAAGIWKDLTDNVNTMASNLTKQVRNVAQVTTAVANGDLSKKVTVDVKGEVLELKNTINTMVDQLSSFASEVTRVAREVGTEGKLGGQAQVEAIAGTWKDLTDNVNFMADNLTGQVRNIAQVTTAVANGDLSTKITVDAKGEILELKNTINTMVDQLSSFASEVTRVAREVGTEGKLGGQAQVEAVAGTWKDLTDKVNFMADNLTGQVRNIAQVTTAVAKGDLSTKITVEAKGEILELKNTINTMVDQLSSFASEVTRVAREVGTEGKLGGQAHVEAVAGTWKDLTDNVNFMADNLTGQVRNIAQVTTAVANGDLSTTITVDAKGEILELKNTINTMVDQLSSFASEVTRVAREVGTEGKLGGQAQVEAIAGTWKDLTDNVNFMADNLTGQVRNIAEVTTAVANGDLSTTITVDAKGEILELKNTINTMVDQLSSFASEVTRVAREVGTEGKLGGQAQVEAVAGTWKDLTDKVNFMADNLTGQVRNIAQVTTAVANGDLSTKITVEAEGEILELKNTINTMVDQLRSFASEVTRVAREVGTEGKLGGQAQVEAIAGTWKDLTDNVNFMADNLTGQVRNIAQVTTAVAKGDLSTKITVEAKGEILELKNTINTMVDQLSSFASEVTRVAREVGTEGKLGGQAQVEAVGGTWKDLTDKVNFMANNLTGQVRNIAQVTTAVAKGDLSTKITVEAKGEILELKSTINTMVDQLNSFAEEVTRIAREVGTEGKLGGQAQVKGVAGIWKDLTDNVNRMAESLTAQVRAVAEVVTAAAHGDLKRKMAVPAKGEIATLGDTLNDMTETLSTFADQVIAVAKQVGVEGVLGGQAEVPGVAGTWKDLTDSVNQLAANLTSQVRSIAEVATAVTKGDLSQSITVEARGEVEDLKNNVNQMIASLAATTGANEEQNWLKTNLGNFTRMLQGQRDLMAAAKQILSELAPLINAQHGVFYIPEQVGEETELRLFASYAYKKRKGLPNRFKPGEGLVGQCALEKERILMTDVPEDYVQITSGLGEARPLNVVVLPVLFEGDLKAIIELASFNRFTDIQLTFLDQLVDGIGVVTNTITGTARTEELLKESQTMAEELQTQQEELQQTNEELEEKAQLLEQQNDEVAKKNREVEETKVALEDRAEQLALTSKYKSEFLANMSHELRTPLNSLLILAQQLSENAQDNLTPKQVEYAQTIHSSGADLLSLINDILDMAKIESGTTTVEMGNVRFGELRDDIERSFRQVAQEKNLGFDTDLSDTLPQAITTDGKRLRQVLNNLLSNAFKFTPKGKVTLRIEPATSGWSRANDPLNRAQKVVAFSVIDTGVGIPLDKQKIIFEAFQQADGTTTREYGGTGLGLAISREIANMLGGEIKLASTPGQGSTFTLYLPQSYVPAGTGKKTPEAAAPPMPPPVAAAAATTQPPQVPTAMVADDHNDIQPGDRVVLMIEDDVAFAQVLLDTAREKGFKGLVALQGEPGFALAKQFKPDAITLDISLPDRDGWTILDRLKHDPDTRHIPVHLISVDEEVRRGLELGAVTCINKPQDKETLANAFADIGAFVQRQAKNLLVVEDDETQRNNIVELIGNEDVKTTAVATGQDALAALKANQFDCMVLDLMLPDMTGFEVIEKIKEDPALHNLPVVIYTAKELTTEEETELRRASEAIIVKDARSPERLLDETTLFLHRVESNLPEAKRQMLQQVHQSDPALEGKKVLIVDDDMRNVFAITSILESRKIEVLRATNGKDGIGVLKQTPDMDAVLMDMMMPGMDGYETTRIIRQTPGFGGLPIIALTAKAMKGDRDKCIEAGASDYITKPVEADQLLSLLRVWLFKKAKMTHAATAQE